MFKSHSWNAGITTYKHSRKSMIGQDVLKTTGLCSRTIATFTKQWPGKMDDVRVTSPQIPLDQYPNEHLSEEDILNTMVGDLQRIVEYPKLGFQSKHEVPKNVMAAMQDLIKMGYTKHLLNLE